MVARWPPPLYEAGTGCRAGDGEPLAPAGGRTGDEHRLATGVEHVPPSAFSANDVRNVAPDGAGARPDDPIPAAGDRYRAIVPTLSERPTDEVIATVLADHPGRDAVDPVTTKVPVALGVDDEVRAGELTDLVFDADGHWSR